MRTPAFESLIEISAALRASVSGAEAFKLINTRLIIQLGVNLRVPTQAQNRDAQLVCAVDEAIRKMGIELVKGPI